MKLKGTKFQLRVWAYLRKIPRGSVKTYSQVAKGIGKPLAVRAVANAIGKNPYAPKIPYPGGQVNGSRQLLSQRRS